MKIKQQQTQKKLRYSILAITAIVAVALIILVRYTYSQLQWESFHQKRLQAEALVLRLDNKLKERVNIEDKRSIAEYNFLVLSENQQKNIQPLYSQSSLARLPIQSTMPGVMGYFQIDANNQFSSPVLPESLSLALAYGISAQRYQERIKKTYELASILRENNIAIALPQLVENYANTQNIVQSQPAPVFSEENQTQTQTQTKKQAKKSISINSDDTNTKQERIFDQLNSSNRFTSKNKLGQVNELLEKSKNENFDQRSRQLQENQLNKESSREKKSKVVVSVNQNNIKELEQGIKTKTSISRTEKIVVASEPLVYGSSDQASNKLGKVSRAVEKVNSREAEADTITSDAMVEDVLTNKEASDNKVNETLDLQIFESEVEPFKVSLLESGHIILYRSVWTQQQRLIQGMLIDKTDFIETLIQNEFVNSALSNTARLAVAYQDTILSAYGETQSGSFGYLERASQLSGTALFQKSLIPPFDNFNTVFTIGDLYAGASGRVVILAALVIMLAVLLGAWLFNRFANAQQNLMNQQQDFISSVSHELKTPLTSIRMYGEILKEGWASEEKRKEYYHYIFDESERLSRLINNVLQLAKLNRNVLTTNIKPYSVNTLVDLSRSKLSSIVVEKEFELSIECNNVKKEKNINIDEDLYIQIMINLVDNALKYSAKAVTKKIAITFDSTKKETLSISVRDYGPGIEEKKINKMFNLFYRNESEITRETKGTGIGLALVKQHVELMGGKVKARNVEPGLDINLEFPFI